jgi:hypothetical protein
MRVSNVRGKQGQMKPHELRIDAAYVTNCSPEAAYDWLKQRANDIHAAGNRRELLSTVGEQKAAALLEWILLRRKQPLINLGIAQFGRSSAIVRKAYYKAYYTGDIGVRCGAWANIVVGPNELLAESWYTPIDLKRLAELGAVAEITSLASNPKIGDQALVDLIQRCGAFAKLSETKYRQALVALGDNPRLAQDYGDDRPMDGWGEYQHGRAFDAAWGLAILLPANQHWAYVLHSLLRNCVKPTLFKEVDAAIERWRIDKNEWDASY